MKKILALVGLCLLELLLSGDIRQIHILQTADIHAQLQPTYKGNGGWLRAATLITFLRQQLGKDRTLLIDCGDTVQGTLAASLSKGMVAIPPLDYLNYDAWIPGNHELDYGIPQFLTFMRKTKAIHICGNLSIQGHPPFVPWKLFTRNGVRIALIGINSSFLKNWLLPKEAAKLNITPARKLLPKLLAEILPHKPHLIVLAAHQGWFRGFDPRQANEINDIAQNFPEIDLILGGHTHRLIPGTKIGIRTWYVQPEAHATHVAHITVTVDTDKQEPLHITSRTLPVEGYLPPDPGLQNLLQPFIEQERNELLRPIKGFLRKTASAKGTPGLNCPISELLAMAMAEQGNARVAFHSRLSKRPLPKGPLTARHLYEVVPYDNTLVTAMLNRQEIQAILTEQLKWRKHYSYNGIYGLKTILDDKGNVILDPTDANLPKDDITRINVAFHSHAAAGSGRFLILRSILARPESQTVNHPITTRYALETFLEHHPGLIVKPVRWLAK